MSRKVIQICEAENTLHCLCNDGTVWRWSGDLARWCEVEGPSNAPTAAERREVAAKRKAERNA